jgi:hypothetical protein
VWVSKGWISGWVRMAVRAGNFKGDIKYEEDNSQNID